MQRSQHLLLEPLVPPSPREEPKVEEPEAPMAARQRHQPGKPGSRSCLCHGEVLILLGHYGWLVSQEPLEHPGADRNGGRIYMRRCDVAAGAPLAPGDAVTFYLYADDRGLGAEAVRLAEESEGGARRGRRTRSCGAEERDGDEAPVQAWRSRAAPPPSGLSAGAAEFVPEAPAKTAAQPPSWQMAPTAKEFVPGQPLNSPPAMRATAQAFIPTALATHAAWCAPAARPLAINLAYFGDDSDDEDDSDAEEGKARSAASGSTGAPSGSDSESEEGEQFAPPPGLPLPPHFAAGKLHWAAVRPPPDLCLP